MNYSRFEKWSFEQIKHKRRCPHDGSPCVPMFKNEGCRKCYEEAQKKDERSQMPDTEK